MAHKFSISFPPYPTAHMAFYLIILKVLITYIKNIIYEPSLKQDFFFSKWHHLIFSYASQKQMSSLIRPSTSFLICQTPSVSFPKIVTSYAHFVPFPMSSFSTKCHHFPLNYCITPYLIYLHPFCLFPYHSQGDHIFS